jgi:hypothetical protein
VTGPGFQNQNFPTGIVVPSGDFLCGGLTSIIMSTSAWVTVSGYDVPTGSVQAPNGA